MCLLFPPRVHSDWAGSKPCLLEQILVFILGKNPFLKTSRFKELSGICIIRNSMHIKILEKPLHFPALLVQPRCCGTLPCHCGGLCPPCAVTTPALAAPWHGDAFPQFRHTKEQFPLGVQCKKSAHTPGFCSETVLNHYSPAGTQHVCLSPNLVKFGWEMLQAERGKGGKHTHSCNVTLWVIKEEISYVIYVFFSCYSLPLCFKQEKLLFLK